MSESLLAARNVFVDTGAYERQRYRFDHAALRKLKELGRAGQVHILVTDTVDGEVRGHIAKNVENAAVAFGRVQGHAGILEGVPVEEFQVLFRPLDTAKMHEAALAVWDSFLRDAKVERISAACVQGAELLQLYFSQEPPFSAKKKSEFPDAISLLSLARWCELNAAQVYVVGDDPDLQAWCSERAGMYHVSTLNDFLDLYNRAEEKLSELVKAIFEREEDWILSAIEETFLECTFTYTENWEAYVENVRVTSTRVDNVDVIEVDEHRFVLALDMLIEFRANVSGADHGQGWWDIGQTSYDFEVTASERFDVSFEVKYDISKETATEILDVLFNDGKEIRVRDEHGWPYK